MSSPPSQEKHPANDTGLTDQGGDIAMNITWVTRFPTGHEQGRYLTLDMGGTNLRVCEIILSPQPGEYEALQRKYKLPGHLRSAPGDDLWDFAADCVGSFLHEHHQGGQCEEKLPLAFTFSYPVEQTSIKSGKLQHWTKDFSSPGVEGHDVVLQLEEALERKVCCCHHRLSLYRVLKYGRKSPSPWSP